MKKFIAFIAVVTVLGGCRLIDKMHMPYAETDNPPCASTENMTEDFGVFSMDTTNANFAFIATVEKSDAQNTYLKMSKDLKGAQKVDYVTAIPATALRCRSLNAGDVVYYTNTPFAADDTCANPPNLIKPRACYTRAGVPTDPKHTVIKLKNADGSIVAGNMQSFKAAYAGVEP